jgi:hypothetical protein
VGSDTVAFMPLTRSLAATTLALAAVAGGAAIADAAGSQKVTPTRVGGVHLGERHSALRAAGLVGPLRPGCELGGPSTRSARLKAPLKGSVDYTLKNPRRVASIAVTGGAKARGVGVGSTAQAVRNAFPKAKFDHSTDKVFLITLVKVPKDGGGKLQFAVSTKTHRVVTIGVPFIAFCE